MREIVPYYERLAATRVWSVAAQHASFSLLAHRGRAGQPLPGAWNRGREQTVFFEFSAI